LGNGAGNSALCGVLVWAIAALATRRSANEQLATACFKTFTDFIAEQVSLMVIFLLLMI
jgi:hypothetical protein